MARSSAVLAFLATLLAPLLAFAGPLSPPYDYFWRFTGEIVAVAASDSPDALYAPLLTVGDRVEGLVGVHLPPEAPRDGTLDISSFEIESYGGMFSASFAASAPFDPLARTAAPIVFAFESSPDGYVQFSGPTGDLLDIGGVAEAGYRGDPFLQFRWGLEGGTIQQLANADGFSEPSHFFTYRWTATAFAVPVPEPLGGLLLATGLAAVAGAARHRARRPL